MASPEIPIWRFLWENHPGVSTTMFKYWTIHNFLVGRIIQNQYQHRHRIRLWIHEPSWVWCLLEEVLHSQWWSRSPESRWFVPSGNLTQLLKIAIYSGFTHSRFPSPAAIWRPPNHPSSCPPPAENRLSEWQGENVVGTDLQTSNIKLYHLPEFFTGSTLQILQTISKIPQTSVS